MKTQTAWEIRFNEPDGTTQYVLATDYAALAAENDALKRRINPDGAPVDVAALCMEIDAVTDERDEWKRRCERAEGDNKRLSDLWNRTHGPRIAEGRDK